MAATSLDIQCFSPRNSPFLLAPFKSRHAKLQVSDRASCASRLVLGLSSVVLRLQEPFDPACRPFLRINDEDNDYEDEANGNYEGSCNGNSDDDISNGSTIGNWNDHENSSNGITHHQSGSPNGVLSSDPNSAAFPEIEERERLRRERIGLANKGRTPWNKGKSHSPETIARLKERNKIVMQDPKIREKLRQHSHPQSQETREKIRIFMKSRMEVERRQLTIVKEWKDSIASMARRGVVGEDELQWNSYQILKKELHKQHYQAKKTKRKEQGSKTLQFEHRLRISESVRAKWADPEYRNRVVERIQETRPKGPRMFRGKIVDPEFDLILDTVTSVSIDHLSQNLVSSHSKVGTYNDPLSEEKLKKIKMLRERNIARKDLEPEMEMVESQFVDLTFIDSEEERENPLDVEAGDGVYDGPMLEGSAQVADMAALQHAQHEAAERARILLAEAEQAAVLAAQALDAAGAHDESLSDSLLEAWTLLDEANKSILNSKGKNMSTR